MGNTLNTEGLKNQVEQSAETPEEVRAETLRLLEEAKSIISKAEGTEKYDDFKEEYDEMMQEMSIALQDGIINEKELGKLRNEIIDVREGEDIYAIERAAMKAKEKIKNGIINSLTAGIEKFNTLGSDEILPKLSYFTDFIGFFSNKENKQDIEKKLIAFQNNMENSSLSEAEKLLKISQFIFDIGVDNSGLSSSILGKFIETANNNVQKNIIESIKKDPSQPLIIGFSRDKGGNYIQSRADFEQKIQNTSMDNINSKSLASYFLHLKSTGEIGFDFLISKFGYKNISTLSEIWERNNDTIAKNILISQELGWIVDQAEMYDDIVILLGKNFEDIIEQDMKDDLRKILVSMRGGKITEESLKTFGYITGKLQENKKSEYSNKLMIAKITRNPNLLNIESIYDNIDKDQEIPYIQDFFLSEGKKLLPLIKNKKFILSLFQKASSDIEFENIYKNVSRPLQLDTDLAQKVINRSSQLFFDTIPGYAFIESADIQNMIEKKVVKDGTFRQYFSVFLSQYPDNVKKIDDFLQKYQYETNAIGKENIGLPLWYQQETGILIEGNTENDIFAIKKEWSLQEYLNHNKNKIEGQSGGAYGISYGELSKKYLLEKGFSNISTEDKEVFQEYIARGISLSDFLHLNSNKEFVTMFLEKNPQNIQYINSSIINSTDIVSAWIRGISDISDIGNIKLFNIQTLQELKKFTDALSTKFSDFNIFNHLSIITKFRAIEFKKTNLTNNEKVYIKKFSDLNQEMSELYKVTSKIDKISKKKQEELKNKFDMTDEQIQKAIDFSQEVLAGGETYLIKEIGKIKEIFGTDEIYREFFKNIQKKEIDNIKTSEKYKKYGEDFKIFLQNKTQGENINILIDEFIEKEGMDPESAKKFRESFEKLIQIQKAGSLGTKIALDYARGKVPKEEFTKFKYAYETLEIFGKEKGKKILIKNGYSQKDIQHYEQEIQKEFNTNGVKDKQYSDLEQNTPENNSQISHYTETESGYTITSTSGETIEGVTPEEFKEIQKSPEALKNFIDFKEICEDPTLNIQFIWEYREQFLHTYKLVTGDTIGVDTKDGDMLSKTEVKKLLDFIANTTNSENIASTNFSDAARRIRDINGNTLDGGGKNEFGEGRILQIWKQKGFFDRNSMFKFQIEKMKQAT